MIRRIIKIDRELCNGCGACAAACHEGAIEMVGGKAQLTREDYCDGLGDCLPACPTGAITFEEREAPAYDEAAVKRAQAAKKAAACSGGCPGSLARQIERREEEQPVSAPGSQLRNWPVQIKLAPVQSPYFDGAHLVGCPKLDGVDYAEKLAAIIADNDVQSVTIVRMEVPCCGGLENAAKRAIQASGKFLPWQVVTVTADGRIKDR